MLRVWEACGSKELWSKRLLGKTRNKHLKTPCVANSATLSTRLPKWRCPREIFNIPRDLTHDCFLKSARSLGQSRSWVRSENLQAKSPSWRSNKDKFPLGLRNSCPHTSAREGLCGLECVPRSWFHWPYSILQVPSDPKFLQVLQGSANMWTLFRWRSQKQPPSQYVLSVPGLESPAYKAALSKDFAIIDCGV